MGEQANCFSSRFSGAHPCPPAPELRMPFVEVPEGRGRGKNPLRGTLESSASSGEVHLTHKVTEGSVPGTREAFSQCSHSVPLSVGWGSPAPHTSPEPQILPSAPLIFCPQTTLPLTDLLGLNSCPRKRRGIAETKGPEIKLLGVNTDVGSLCLCRAISHQLGAAECSKRTPGWLLPEES